MIEKILNFHTFFEIHVRVLHPSIFKQNYKFFESKATKNKAIYHLKKIKRNEKQQYKKVSKCNEKWERDYERVNIILF
jgi:hypothetical protein